MPRLLAQFIDFGCSHPAFPLIRTSSLYATPRQSSKAPEVDGAKARARYSGCSNGAVHQQILLFNSYSCDPKILDTSSLAFLLRSPLSFMRLCVGTMYRQQDSWRELQLAAVDRDLIRKSRARGVIKHMKKTLRDQDITLRHYKKRVYSLARSRWKLYAH